MFHVDSGSTPRSLNNLQLFLAPPPLVSLSSLVSGEKIVSSDRHPWVIGLTHIAPVESKQEVGMGSLSRAKEWNPELVVYEMPNLTVDVNFCS